MLYRAPFIVLLSITFLLTDANAFTKDWDKWPAPQQRGFASKTLKEGSEEDKLRLLKFCLDRFSAELLEERRVNSNTGALVAILQTAMNGEQRDAWIKAADNVPNPMTLPLNVTLDINSVLRRVGVQPEKAASIFIRWIESPKNWKAINKDSLDLVAEVLVQADVNGRSRTADLIARINQQHLVKPSHDQGISVADWKQLTSHLGNSLDESTIAKWRANLQALTTDEVVKSMPYVNALDLGHALHQLGDKDTRPLELLNRWIAINPSWKEFSVSQALGLAQNQSKLSGKKSVAFINQYINTSSKWKEEVNLLELLRLADGAGETETTRHQVLDWALKRYQADPEIREKGLAHPGLLRRGNLQMLPKSLDGEDEETKLAWARLLRTHFSQQKILSEFSFGNGLSLKTTLSKLQGNSDTDFILNLLKNGEKWRPPESLEHLIRLSQEVKDNPAKSSHVLATTLDIYRKDAALTFAAFQRDGTFRYIGLLPELLKNSNAANREAWTSWIRSNVLKKDMLAKLTPGQIKTAADLVDDLAGKKQNTILDTYFQVSDKWKDAKQLNHVVQLAKWFDQGSEQSLNILRNAHSQYLADAKLATTALKEIPPNDLKALAHLIKGKDKGFEQSWADLVRRLKFSDDRVRIMSPVKAKDAYLAMREFSQAYADDLVKNYIETSTHWKATSDLHEIQQLLGAVKNKPTLVASILGQTLARYQQDPKVRKQGLANPHLLTGIYRFPSYFSKEDHANRKAWGSIFQEYFCQNDVAQTLSSGAAVSVQNTINHLAGTKTSDVLNRFVQATDSWKQPKHFSSMTKLASGVVDPKVRSSILNYALDQYQSNTQLAASVLADTPIGNVKTLINLLKHEPDAARQRWANLIRETRFSEAKIQQWTPAEAREIYTLSRVLSESKADELLNRYLTKSPQWKAANDLNETMQLADAAKGKAKLVATLFNQTLARFQQNPKAQTKGLANPALLGRIHQLASHFHKDDQVNRKAWATLLQGHFVHADVARPLDGIGAANIQTAINQLAGSTSTKVLEQFIQSSNSWKKPEQLKVIVGFASKVSNPSIRASILDYALNQYRSDPKLAKAGIANASSSDLNFIRNLIPIEANADREAWAKLIVTHRSENLQPSTADDVMRLDAIVSSLSAKHGGHFADHVITRSELGLTENDFVKVIGWAEAIKYSQAKRAELLAVIVNHFQSHPTLTEKMLSTPKFPGDVWRFVALLSHSDASVKQQFTKLIDEHFVESRLKILPIGSALALGKATKTLKESEQAAFLARYVSTSSKWETPDAFFDMLRLAQDVRSVPASQSTVLKYMFDQYKSNPTLREKALHPETFPKIYRVFRLALTTEDESIRTDWAKLITKHYSDSLIKPMQPRDLLNVQSTVNTLKANADDKMAKRYVAVSDQWKTPKEFVLLIEVAKHLPEVGNSRQTVLDFALNTYQRDSSAAQAVMSQPNFLTTAPWINRLVHRDNKPAREAWAKVIAEYFSQEPVLHQSSLTHALSTYNLLREIGSTRNKNYIQKYVETSNAWKAEQSLARLIELAKVVSGPSSQPSDKSPARIAQFLFGRYLNRIDLLESSIAKLHGSQVREFIRVLRIHSDTKHAWWGQVLTSVLSNPAVSNQLGSRKLFELHPEFQKLRPDEPNIILYRYVLDSQAWQDDRLEDLIRIAQLGKNTDDQVGFKARDRVADYLYQKYASDPANLKKLTKNQLRDIGRVAALSPESIRQSWAKGLLGAALPDPDELQKMAIGDVRRLVRTVAGVDTNLGQSIAHRYLTTANLSKQPMGTLYTLGKSAIQTNELTESDRTAVGEAIESAWVSQDEATTFSVEETLRLSSFWDMVGDENKKDHWLSQGYERGVGTESARKQIDLENLQVLAFYMIRYEKTRSKTEFESFAHAIVEAAQANTLKDAPKPDYLGYVVDAPASRKIVEKALVDEQGQVRPSIARVLTHTYLKNGKLKDWQKTLDTLNDNASGDAKAVGLLSRAYAQAPSDRVAPIQQQRTMLDEALASAESAPVRIQVLGQYKTYFDALKRPELTLAMLNRQRDQFKDSSIDAFASLYKQVELQVEKKRIRDEASRQRETRAHNERAINSLRDSMRRAKLDGDTRSFARLQNRLDALKKQHSN